VDREKKIDEFWKESAYQETEKIIVPGAEENEEDQMPAGEIEVTFFNYITSLMYQAMVFLGEIPNPVSNQTEVNLTQAKLLIDTLAMLKEKTKGNLIKQEEDMLGTAVYELQLRFVEVSQGQV
jgi:hypothetical protein